MLAPSSSLTFPELCFPRPDLRLGPGELTEEETAEGLSVGPQGLTINEEGPEGQILSVEIC